MPDAVGVRHHLAGTTNPDQWRIVDISQRPLRGHVCDLLCEPVYVAEHLPTGGACGEHDVQLLHRVAAAVQNGLYSHGGIDPGTAACYSAAAAVLADLGSDVLSTGGADAS